MPRRVTSRWGAPNRGRIITYVRESAVASSAAELFQRLQSGDLRALSRAISAVEDDSPGAAELLHLCRNQPRRAFRLGVTGPPGVGKSTLVDQLVRSFRERGRTLGVLAIDPSSPYTGGALLGDRIRLQDFAGDPGVYFRSMASRGATGGLAASASSVCDVIQAAGREIILIETVGAGQDEIEIASVADVTLLVLFPGLGDEVQSLKAGTMEIADIFVINKADTPGAEALEKEILAVQSLASPQVRHWTPPVVRTVATTGEGFTALVQQIDRCLAFKSDPGLPKRSTVPVSGADEPRLDHIGIAVRSIAVSRQFYEALGIAVAHEETVAHEQVKTAMLPLGDTRLELLEATAEDSTIGRFIAKRGEGPHHLAIRVEDIDNAFERLRTKGVRLASDCIRVGAGGHHYFFIHPASTGGVLLEIVGHSRSTAAVEKAQEVSPG